MTNKKLTIKELREQIHKILKEDSVNFWSTEYFWNPGRDSIDDLVKGALRWYGFERAPMHLTSPADPRFLKALYNRMKLLGIDEKTRDQVIFKVRLHKASNVENRSAADPKTVK